MAFPIEWVAGNQQVQVMIVGFQSLIPPQTSPVIAVQEYGVGLLFWLLYGAF